MNTNLYDFVLDKLRSTRLTRAEIAAGSGVPVSTLNKIAVQKSANPGIRHIEALANFFQSGQPAAMGDVMVFPTSPATPAAPDTKAAATA